MTRLLMVLMFLGCQDAPPPEPVLRPVRSMIPSAMQGELPRTFRGATQSSEQAAIGFKVGGRLATVAVKVGDVVTAGQLLAELDATELRLQQSQAAATLAQAQASARVARTNLERIEALYVNNNASAADVDGARANADASAAQVVAAARQLDLARSQVKDAKIFATRGGAVAQTMANEGELVGAGNPVVVITSGERLEAVFAVPGDLIARINRGMTAQIRVRSAGEQTLTASVTEVGVVASGATFPVTAVFDDATPSLRPGLPVEVDLVLPPITEQSALVVPLTAIGESDGERFVWVVTPAEEGTGTISKVTVETGSWSADGIEVLNGLSGDERVVTAGVSRIYDGQVVRLDAGEAL